MGNKLEILIFTAGFGLHLTNLFAPVSELLLEIANYGHTLHLVCREEFLDFNIISKNRNIRIYPVRTRSAKTKYLLIKDMFNIGQSIIKNFNVDLIYGHSHIYLGVIGSLLSMIHRKPYFHWLCSDGRKQAKESSFLRWTANTLLSGFIHFNSRKMITGCQWIAKEQSKSYFIDFRKKYEFSANSVNILRFQNQTRNLREIFNNNDPIIIYVSSLEYRKGADIFIDAIIYLLNDNIKINALICGDGKLKERLIKKIKNHKYTERVHFAGPVASSDLPNYLLSADIFCVPARFQGFPRSYIEAMAAKLPIITTNVGCTDSIIDSGVSGIICEPNVLSVCQNIIKLIESKELQRKIANNAFEKVKTEFNIKIVALRYLEIFKSNIKE